MSDDSQTVEVSHESARDESVCGVFCDAEPEVSFEAFGYTFHWCRDCYEGPCSRCHEPIPEGTRGSTRAKGWCEDCREEVKLLCGDDDRGIQKENGEEQAKLLTDGGRQTAGGQQIPLCTIAGCDELADVAVVQTPSVNRRPRAYCEGHAFKGSSEISWTVIRRWPAEEDLSLEPVYAYRSGNILHLEHPDGSEALCSRYGHGRKRYNLSIAVPDGCRLCGRCCDMTAWADEVDDVVVGSWIRSVREIASTIETITRQAQPANYTYPKPDARELHKVAEGI